MAGPMEVIKNILPQLSPLSQLSQILTQESQNETDSSLKSPH